jgi:pimeloyl-ACP methyl ester carboxylesterase
MNTLKIKFEAATSPGAGRMPRRGATLGPLSSDIDELVVKYVDRPASDPHAPTVVFLHNGGGSRKIWEATMNQVQGDVRLLALDWPGYGESDSPVSGFRRADYTAALEQFMEHIVKDRSAILVGHCMGSAFAWSLTIRQPDMVGALVLINPLTEQTAKRGTWGVLTPIAKRFDLGRFAGWLVLPRMLNPIVIAGQLGTTGLRRGLWWSQRHLAAQWGDRGRVRGIASLFHDMSSYAELDQFSRPQQWPWTAMVWGTANWSLSPRAGRRLASGLRPDLNVRLRGAGHLAMLEEPEQIANIVGQAIDATAQRRALSANVL